MNRKQKIIVSITGIVIITLFLIGLTYAYFLARIKGNSSDKSIAGTFANLELTYADGNGILESSDAISPGTVIGTKTFTVENTGNGYVNYGVVLENVVNTLTRPEDLVYVLTCTSSDGKNCNGTASPESADEVNERMFPTKDLIIMANRIEKGVTHSYELTVTYKEANVDQSVDMGATFSAKVNINDFRSLLPNTNAESLSYQLINNAINATTGETRSIFKLSPQTIPAAETTTTSERIKYIWTESSWKPSDSWKIDYADSYTDNGSSYTLSSITTGQYSNIYNDITGKYFVYSGWPSTTTNEIYKVVSATKDKVIIQRYSYIYKSLESTLSIAEDNSGTSYYYRGAVTDNYITFNNMCWRIVRIEGDGSTKIVLEDEYAPCSESTNNDSSTIGTGDYGYTGSGTESDPYRADYANSVGRTTSMRYVLNDWLDKNFDSSDKSKLKLENWYIGDTTTKYDSSGNITTSTPWYYETRYRLYTSKYATLINKSTDTYVTDYIGTLTADEVAYAGAMVYTTNDNYYLYVPRLGTSGYWTLSLSVEDSHGDGAFRVRGYYGGDDSGYLGGGYVFNSLVAFRPAVTLQSEVEVTGNGTKTDPYVVS